MTAAQAREWLPDVEDLRRLCQSLAVLDAILCPEWEYRYFSFNASWAPGEMLASMRNGEGDDFLVFWNRHGAILKGFVHSSPIARNCPWPGVLDGAPAEFQAFLNEPASRDQTTFCLWRGTGDSLWTVGEINYPDHADPDGSSKLLRFLDGEPETYRRWAEEYFGTRLDPRAIEHVYRHGPLSPFVFRALNPEATVAELGEELRQIGYPV